MMHHAKREDDGFDRLVVIRVHKSKPFPRAVCCPDAQDGTEVTPKADGTYSERCMDMHGLRRALPHRWAEFCHRHFRNSTDLAAFFDVDEKCARNWLEGKHAPASAFTLRAVSAFPDAVPLLLGAE